MDSVLNIHRRLARGNGSISAGNFASFSFIMRNAARRWRVKLNTIITRPSSFRLTDRCLFLLLFLFLASSFFIVFFFSVIRSFVRCTFILSFFLSFTLLRNEFERAASKISFRFKSVSRDGFRIKYPFYRNRFHRLNRLTFSMRGNSVCFREIVIHRRRKFNRDTWSLLSEKKNNKMTRRLLKEVMQLARTNEFNQWIINQQFEERKEKEKQTRTHTSFEIRCTKPKLEWLFIFNWTKVSYQSGKLVENLWKCSDFENDPSIVR